LRANIGKVDAVLLTAAFSTRHPELRNVIAAELSRRGLIGEVRAAAQVDKSEFIRILEYRDRLRSAAANASEPPRLPDNLSYKARCELEVERLRGVPYELLKQKVDWLNPEGSAAYEVLVTDHWELMAEQVRADIGSNFERIRRKTIDELTRSTIQDTQSVYDALPATAQEALETGAKAAIEKQVEELDAFVREKFAAAALVGISQHGLPDDAPFVRGFLDKSSFYLNSAISAIVRVGDQTDSTTLVQIALESYAEHKLQAAEAALLLSQDPREIIDRLVRSNDPSACSLWPFKIGSVRWLRIKVYGNRTASQ
jgi:hypothetical protein